MTMTEASNTTLGPLAGLRVLELADEKGHYCGKLMADMGADVIKIEPPGGDGARRGGAGLRGPPGPQSGPHHDLSHPLRPDGPLPGLRDLGPGEPGHGRTDGE